VNYRVESNMRMRHGQTRVTCGVCVMNAFNPQNAQITQINRQALRVLQNDMKSFRVPRSPIIFFFLYIEPCSFKWACLQKGLKRF